MQQQHPSAEGTPSQAHTCSISSVILYITLLLLQTRNLAKERLPYAPAAATPAASQQQAPAASDNKAHANTPAAAAAGQQGAPAQPELGDIQLLPRMADKFVSVAILNPVLHHTMDMDSHSLGPKHPFLLHVADTS
jgi:hypothetical protein